MRPEHGSQFQVNFEPPPDASESFAITIGANAKINEIFEGSPPVLLQCLFSKFASGKMGTYKGVMGQLDIVSISTNVYNAVIEFKQVVKYLWSESFRGVTGVPGMRRLYPSLVISVLLCLIGLFVFFAILVE